MSDQAANERKASDHPDDGGHDEGGLQPMGQEGAQLKQKITESKGGDQARTFDPGASMLGTDNEAGAPPDADGMAEARKAPQPG